MEVLLLIVIIQLAIVINKMNKLQKELFKKLEDLRFTLDVNSDLHQDREPSQKSKHQQEYD